MRARSVAITTGLTAIAAGCIALYTSRHWLRETWYLSILSDNQRSWDERLAAGVELGSLKSLRAIDMLLTATDESGNLEFIEEPFERLGHYAVPRLMVLSCDPSDEEKGHALQALFPIPAIPEAVDTFITAVESSHCAARWILIDKLGSLGVAADSAIPALLRVVNNNAETTLVRSHAVRALGNLGSGCHEAIVDSLLALLGNSPKECRSEAVAALGSLGCKSARVLSCLERAVHDEDAEVRFNADGAMKELMER